MNVHRIFGYSVYCAALVAQLIFVGAATGNATYMLISGGLTTFAATGAMFGYRAETER